MVAKKVTAKRDWERLFAQRDDYERWFEHNSYLLDSPAMLLGNEMHTVHFDWDQAAKDGTLNDHFKVALVEVNPSPFASCTAAIRLFYQQLHEYNPSWVVERAFSPVSCNNRLMMEQAGIAPVSAEGKMPLASFDVLSISQQLIGDEVSLLYMLKQSGIPLRRQDRTGLTPSSFAAARPRSIPRSSWTSATSSSSARARTTCPSSWSSSKSDSSKVAARRRSSSR